MTLPLNRLNCVLRATDAAHVDAVTNWLRVSARVGEIINCGTDTDLRAELADRAPDNLPDFVVLVVSHQELPPYLLRYPDLRVLVLTTHRKVGSLTPWLQQGASDVASLSKPEQVQHALGRMIDERAMQRHLGLLATELLRSEARYATLVRNNRNAMSFWRDNELLACSPAFADITGVAEGATTEDWLGQMDSKSRSGLSDQLDDFPSRSRAVIKSHGQTISIAREPTCEACDDNEHLFSVKLVLDSSNAQNSLTTDWVEQPEEIGAREAALVAAELPNADIVLAEQEPNLSDALSHSAAPIDNLSAEPVASHIAADPIRISSAANKNLTPEFSDSVSLASSVDTEEDVAEEFNVEKQPATQPTSMPALETDSCSGLPARQTLVSKFQHLLQSANDGSRYVAMMVDLSETALVDDSGENGTDEIPLDASQSMVMAAQAAAHVDRTIQDLAVYRAADRLSQTLNPETLLGRISDDRLLIVRELAANEVPRMLAKGIRRSLGSLGGLLGSPEAVRINTVNISAAQGASAEGLVTRLENR